MQHCSDVSLCMCRDCDKPLRVDHTMFDRSIDKAVVCFSYLRFSSTCTKHVQSISIISVSSTTFSSMSTVLPSIASSVLLVPYSCSAGNFSLSHYAMSFRRAVMLTGRRSRALFPTKRAACCAFCHPRYVCVRREPLCFIVMVALWHLLELLLSAYHSVGSWEAS